MKNYKVRDKINKTSWESIKAESAYDSAAIFFKSKESDEMEVEVVDSYGNKSSHQLPQEAEANDSTQAVAVSSDNFQPILHKLDEIHSTMKAIRWTIAGGFLFIILVISGIIKPGIFG